MKIEFEQDQLGQFPPQVAEALMRLASEFERKEADDANPFSDIKTVDFDDVKRVGPSQEEQEALVEGQRSPLNYGGIHYDKPLQQD